MGEGLAKRLCRIEGSLAVKDSLQAMNTGVFRRKKEFNRLDAERRQLECDKEKLTQVLTDLTSAEKFKNDDSNMLTILQEQSGERKLKLNEEKVYTMKLKHMISTRTDFILDIVNTVRELQKATQELGGKIARMLKVLEQDVSSTKGKGRQLVKIDGSATSRREDMREQLGHELKLYEDRRQAITFYRKTKEDWHKRMHLTENQKELDQLKQLKGKYMQEEGLRNEVEYLKKLLHDKEAYISKELVMTNTNSIEEFTMRLEKIKETKECLMSTQTELKNSLNQYSTKLGSDLDSMKQVNYPSSLRVLTNLETEYRNKRNNLQRKASQLDKLQQQTSSLVLTIHRLTRRSSKDLILQDDSGIYSALVDLDSKLKELN